MPASGGRNGHFVPPSSGGRYRASHRRPIICRDFGVVISSVGASRINWCIIKPAIFYQVPAILGPRQGPLSTLVQTRRYFRQGPSVLWYKHVEKYRSDCTVQPLHPRSNLYRVPKNRYLVLLAVAFNPTGPRGGRHKTQKTKSREVNPSE